MLTFEEFIEIIKNEILDHMSDVYITADVDIVDVKKNNGLTLKGLVIRTKSSSIAPTIYMDSFYKEYQEGEGVEEIMDKIAKIRTEHEIEMPEVVNDMNNFNSIVDKIIPRIVGKIEWNIELMQERPYHLIQDLVVFFAIDLEIDGGTGTIWITNKMMEMWNVEKSDVIGAAYNNMKYSDYFDSQFRSMFETLKELMPIDDLGLIPETEDQEMYVLSNKKSMFGASLLWNTTTLDAIADKIGRFIIIPSSIHEVLITPCYKNSPNDENKSIKELNEMVKCINETEVDKKDWLSDHVYMYSLEGGLETPDEE